MGAGPSTLNVLLVFICQPKDDRAQHLRRSAFANALSAQDSRHRSAVLSSRALDSRTGGGCTCTHTSEASGGRADSRRKTVSRASSHSGRRTTTQHGERDTGHSGSRTTSHHGSCQPSHGGSQRGQAAATAAPRESRSHHGSRQPSHGSSQSRRATATAVAREPRLSGVGTNPPRRVKKTVRWGTVEYRT